MSSVFSLLLNSPTSIFHYYNLISRFSILIVLGFLRKANFLMKFFLLLLFPNFINYSYVSFLVMILRAQSIMDMFQFSALFFILFLLHLVYFSLDYQYIARKMLRFWMVLSPGGKGTYDLNFSSFQGAVNLNLIWDLND